MRIETTRRGWWNVAMWGGMGVVLVAGPAMAADGTAPTAATSALDASARRIDYSEVLSRYRAEQAQQPLSYDALGTTPLDGGEKRAYLLRSQNWPAGGGADPAQWTHRIEVFIPNGAKPRTALLFVNNGVRRSNGTEPESPPTNLDPDTAFGIAKATQRIVISVADVPNQYLTLPGDTAPKREDALVAATWRRFLDDPIGQVTTPLHVPMAEAAVKAMDLAQAELRPWNVRGFVIAGASKRAWSSWLTAIADPRVEGIVSFVIEMRIRALFDYLPKVYGGNWPIAVGDYYREGIHKRLDEPGFAQLMSISDPFTYLRTRYRQRLQIPKYLVNASGDDFFPPDFLNQYVDELPGPLAVRVAPNSDHGGIRPYFREAIVGFMNRFGTRQALPAPSARVIVRNGATALTVRYREAPVSATLWRADNPTDRNFRYACGIRYLGTPLTLGKGRALDVPLAQPATGWSAVFVELRYADGFVATTPVQVFPQTFPTQPPADGAGACKTLPGQ